ncbi:YciI family protein [Massilia sp. CT11-108]|uniref:YciI family protein n=1 Tax=Massilia sp. CT11-108 TaxID=3393900 RepID=UPI0039A57E12
MNYDGKTALVLGLGESGLAIALWLARCGARVRVANGGASIIDGPFAEAKELIAGFWMIRASSIDAALDWARTLPYPTGPEVEVEVRPVALIAPWPHRPAWDRP